MSRTTTCIPAQPELPRRLRAAGYARVSSGKDAMLQSLSAQVSYYNNYIQRRRDWVYAGVFVDEAVTGTHDSRQGFQRLLDACRAGEIDVIVTKSISRFARNTVTLLETIRELRALEVNVFFEREGIYSMSADGELLLTLLASFAQEESLSCSENCKWRIRKDFQEGRPNTGNMLGYHLVDGVLTIIPEEAALVQQVFVDYLSGMGVQAIANKYRKQGINFSTSGLAKMLRNEKYAGNLLLQKTFRLDHISKKGVINRGELPMYFVEDSHEPTIPKTQFAQVQAEIARRAARHQPVPQAPQRYPFTGLITCRIGQRLRHILHTRRTKKQRRDPLFRMGRASWRRLGSVHNRLAAFTFQYFYGYGEYYSPPIRTNFRVRMLFARNRREFCVQTSLAAVAGE